MFDAHHHVFAVQNRGGTQEFYRGTAKQLSPAEACRLAAGMIAAPGWDAVWIIDCASPCSYDDVFNYSSRFWERTPFWDANAACIY